MPSFRVLETDFVKESKVMLDFIEKLKRGEPIMQATTAAPQTTGYGAPAAAPRVSTDSHSQHKSCCSSCILTSIVTVLHA